MGLVYDRDCGLFNIILTSPDLEEARLPVPLMLLHTSLSAREPETNWKRLRKLVHWGQKKGKVVSFQNHCNFPSHASNIDFGAKVFSLLCLVSHKLVCELKPTRLQRVRTYSFFESVVVFIVLSVHKIYRHTLSKQFFTKRF